MPAPRKFKTVMKEVETPKSEAEPQATLPSIIETVSTTLSTTSTSQTKKYNKDYLKQRWTTLSGLMMDYLVEVDPATGQPRLIQLLKDSKLQAIGILAGIATDKVLLMEGQPTQIIAQTQHQDLDRLGLALKDALEKRGLVTLTERVVKVEPPVEENKNG